MCTEIECLLLRDTLLSVVIHGTEERCVGLLSSPLNKPPFTVELVTLQRLFPDLYNMILKTSVEILDEHNAAAQGNATSFMAAFLVTLRHAVFLAAASAASATDNHVPATSTTT